MSTNLLDDTTPWLGHGHTKAFSYQPSTELNVLASHKVYYAKANVHDPSAVSLS